MKDRIAQILEEFLESGIEHYEIRGLLLDSQQVRGVADQIINLVNASIGTTIGQQTTIPPTSTDSSVGPSSVR